MHVDRRFQFFFLNQMINYTCITHLSTCISTLIIKTIKKKHDIFKLISKKELLSTRIIIIRTMNRIRYSLRILLKKKLQYHHKH